MEYTKNKYTSIRHINETSKNGQTILETLQEGLLKEGSKDPDNPANFHPEILTKVPIHYDFVPDERHRGGTQLKVVFPVRIPHSEIRDFAQVDDDNPNEIHGPLKLYEVTDLLAIGNRRHIPFHYDSTRATLAWLARDKKVFMRYPDLVASWRRETLSDEQQRAIDAYPGRW